MLPLIRSLLPSEGSLEANELNKQTVSLNVGENKNIKDAKCHLNLRIAKILLVVAQETADALLDLRYKDFDPLVKNFGCQINALEINTLCRINHEELCAEALSIKAYTEEKLQKLGNKVRGTPGVLASPLDGVTSLSDFLITKAKVDLTITAAMARLVRMRLLCIVNCNKKIDGREVPQTCAELLYGKISRRLPPNVKPILKLIVGGLQAEESLIACRFIRQQAERIPDGLRRDLVMRSLMAERFSTVRHFGIQTPIISLALMHNTEAAISSFRGIICVKNKLQICNEPIVGALAKRVFIKMPEGEPLDVVNLPDEEPIIVIEGYIDNNTNLQRRIMEVGLMNIINANCAVLPQYASGASKAPLEDKEACLDVQRFASCDFDEARKVIEIDHIYAASLREEK